MEILSRLIQSLEYFPSLLCHQHWQGQCEQYQESQQSLGDAGKEEGVPGVVFSNFLRYKAQADVSQLMLQGWTSSQDFVFYDCRTSKNERYWAGMGYIWQSTRRTSLQRVLLTYSFKLNVAGESYHNRKARTQRSKADVSTRQRYRRGSHFSPVNTQRIHLKCLYPNACSLEDSIWKTMCSYRPKASWGLWWHSRIALMSGVLQLRDSVSSRHLGIYEVVLAFCAKLFLQCLQCCPGADDRLVERWWERIRGQTYL